MKRCTVLLLAVTLFAVLGHTVEAADIVVDLNGGYDWSLPRT